MYHIILNLYVINTHTFSHKLHPKCGESRKYRARESYFPFFRFRLFIYLFFFYFIDNEIIYDTMNPDMMVSPRKGAKSPILDISGAIIEVNRRVEQTYCLALLQRYF